MHRVLDSGESCHSALGRITSDLHLLGKRQHVGEQAVGRQRGRVDLPRIDMGLRLVQDAGQVAQNIGKAWHAGLVHGQRHGRFSLSLIRHMHAPESYLFAQSQAWRILCTRAVVE